MSAGSSISEGLFEIKAAPPQDDSLATSYSCEAPWGPSPYPFDPNSRRAIAFDPNHCNHVPALHSISATGARLHTLALLFRCAKEASDRRQ